MSSVSQSMSDMSTNMTSTAVQTDNKVVICEKLQLIQGKLAKALKNANLSLENIPPELLQSVNEEVSALNLDGEDIPGPPSPFNMPVGVGEVIGDEDGIKGLMVAEPAQTLHDTIGDMLSEGTQHLCYVMLCYVMFMLCYAMLCYAMLCYAMLCYAILCYAMLCCVML